MTQTEFSKLVHVEPSSVSWAIKCGRLNGAIFPDNSIRDVALAQKLFNNTATRRRNGTGPEAAPTLAASRLRKIVAQAEATAAKVDAIRNKTADRETLNTITQEAMAPVIARLNKLPSVASQFIGLDDASSFAALRSEVHKALTDIYAIPEPEGQDEEPTSKPPQPDSAIEIDSRRIALQAEELELQTALAAGKLIPIDAFTADLAVKLELLRTALLTLPGRVRLGPLTIQKARATLKAELAQAVRDVGLAAPARGN